MSLPPTSDQNPSESAPPAAETRFLPPDRLPPPSGSLLGLNHSGSPWPAIVWGGLASVALGAAMFFVSLFFYVYVLFNCVLGAGIGHAIAYGSRRGHFKNRSVLLGLAVVCSMLAYLSFNITQAAEFDPRMWLDVIRRRAQKNPFVGGANIGEIGNYILWFAEAGVTCFVAWSTISEALQMMKMREAPREVTAMVVNLLNDDRSIEEVETELAKRGWTSPEDQDRAISAATALMEYLQNQQED